MDIQRIKTLAGLNESADWTNSYHQVTGTFKVRIITKFKETGSTVFNHMGYGNGSKQLKPVYGILTLTPGWEIHFFGENNTYALYPQEGRVYSVVGLANGTPVSSVLNDNRDKLKRITKQLATKPIPSYHKAAEKWAPTEDK